MYALEVSQFHVIELYKSTLLTYLLYPPADANCKLSASEPPLTDRCHMVTVSIRRQDTEGN